MVVAIWALALGCEPEEEKPKDTEPWVAPLAAPWVAIAGSTYDGAFKSTCAISGAIARGGEQVATFAMEPADGGRWAGAALDEGIQFKATMTWDDCENTPDGTGSFESSAFSGNEGDLFVLHYDGVDSGFEWMVQGDDHLGAEVRAQFADGTDLAAVADSLGDVEVADAEDDATTTVISWTDGRNVAEVLAALSADEAFLWGEPTWVEKPAWW